MTRLGVSTFTRVAEPIELAAPMSAKLRAFLNGDPAFASRATSVRRGYTFREPRGYRSSPINWLAFLGYTPTGCVVGAVHTRPAGRLLTHRRVFLDIIRSRDGGLGSPPVAVGWETLHAHGEPFGYRSSVVANETRAADWLLRVLSGPPQGRFRGAGVPVLDVLRPNDYAITEQVLLLGLLTVLSKYDNDAARRDEVAFLVAMHSPQLRFTLDNIAANVAADLERVRPRTAAGQWQRRQLETTV